MKRIIALFMATVMVFSAFALVSCSDEEAPSKTPSNGGGSAVISGEEGDIFYERSLIDDELGDYDFGGRKLRIATHATADFFVEEEDRNKGNLIADAKFTRNKTVEDRFNMEVEVAYSSDYQSVVDWVSKTVLSGADEFDLFSSHTASAGSLVLKNLFLNWYDIPNVDFSKPWWASSCANELTYDGKCILAISDFNYNALSGVYCMVFNKNLANAYDMGNLYEVVNNGDWTYEYFYNLIKDVYTDTDGSGTKTEGDFYGFEQDHWYGGPVSSWLWAFDNPTVAKDEEGVPVVAVKTDKINSIVSTIYDLCYNTNGCYYVNTNDKPPRSIFNARRAIFAICTLGAPTGEDLRNFEDEYGILPMPKWNENQSGYHSIAIGEHTCLAVPKTVKDTEFVGTCIEALSAESYKQVIPTLYEIALKTRYLRDSESKEVLDLVIDGRIYDFGVIYDNWKGFTYTLLNTVGEGSSNFESYYSSKYTSARNHFKRIVKVFDKLG